MISALADDLYNKLNAVPALVGKVGLAVGGMKSDPALSTAPLPLAWALFQSMMPTDPPSAVSPSKQSMQCSFTVFVVVDYKGQADLQATQIPLVESCVLAVRGTENPVGTRWRFEGVNLSKINVDRLYYELRFSANSHL